MSGPISGRPGHLMAAEVAEAPGVFARACAQRVMAELAGRRAIYTIARGSSDAAANVLSYEFMRERGLPMTSLPPSVFSLGRGVDLGQAVALIVSQSGASEDLVRCARGARAGGVPVVAITNAPGSPVEAMADLVCPIGAGPELAVPATKTVVGAIGAGMALLGALVPAYGARLAGAAAMVAALQDRAHPAGDALTAALVGAEHVYVIGRDTGYGAAQEVALKLKETCCLHAEAYSSSEVLHGPLQLVTRPLLVLILDTGAAEIQPSLNIAEARFLAAGGPVFRLRVADVGCAGLTPAAAAAVLLILIYPVIHAVALALGFDPDRPDTLSKVTQTT